MAYVASVKDGNWNSPATWSTTAVPTAEDSVHIYHKVILNSSGTANVIDIEKNGSLYTDPNWSHVSTRTLTVDYLLMFRQLNDDRVVRLDGVNLEIGHTSITAIGGSSDGFPSHGNAIINTEGQIIIDDPGMPAFTAQMQDIKPEGCARAYSRKVSNGVRYMNIIVHIRKDLGYVVGELYRMAENPFQVLAVTNSAVIKGFIEAITPVDNPGKEYRSFKVSIAEGL